jgi:hypothetical protein
MSDWKAVPSEPTREMTHAGMAAFRDEFGSPMTRYENIYRAMLAARPTQPTDTGSAA